MARSPSGTKNASAAFLSSFLKDCRKLVADTAVGLSGLVRRMPPETVAANQEQLLNLYVVTPPSRRSKQNDNPQTGREQNMCYNNEEHAPKPSSATPAYDVTSTLLVELKLLHKLSNNLHTDVIKVSKIGASRRKSSSYYSASVNNSGKTKLISHLKQITRELATLAQNVTNFANSGIGERVISHTAARLLAEQTTKLIREVTSISKGVGKLKAFEKRMSMDNNMSGSDYDDKLPERLQKLERAVMSLSQAIQELTAKQEQAKLIEQRLTYATTMAERRQSFAPDDPGRRLSHGERRRSYADEDSGRRLSHSERRRSYADEDLGRRLSHGERQRSYADEDSGRRPSHGERRRSYADEDPERRPSSRRRSSVSRRRKLSRDERRMSRSDSRRRRSSVYTEEYTDDDDEPEVSKTTETTKTERHSISSQRRESVADVSDDHSVDDELVIEQGKQLISNLQEVAEYSNQLSISAKWLPTLDDMLASDEEKLTNNLNRITRKTLDLLKGVQKVYNGEDDKRGKDKQMLSNDARYLSELVVRFLDQVERLQLLDSRAPIKANRAISKKERSITPCIARYTKAEKDLSHWVENLCVRMKVQFGLDRMYALKNQLLYDLNKLKEDFDLMKKDLTKIAVKQNMDPFDTNSLIDDLDKIGFEVFYLSIELHDFFMKRRRMMNRNKLATMINKLIRDVVKISTYAKSVWEKTEAISNKRITVSMTALDMTKHTSRLHSNVSKFTKILKGLTKEIKNILRNNSAFSIDKTFSPNERTKIREQEKVDLLLDFQVFSAGMDAALRKENLSEKSSAHEEIVRQPTSHLPHKQLPPVHKLTSKLELKYEYLMYLKGLVKHLKERDEDEHHSVHHSKGDDLSNQEVSSFTSSSSTNSNDCRTEQLSKLPIDAKIALRDKLLGLVLMKKHQAIREEFSCSEEDSSEFVATVENSYKQHMSPMNENMTISNGTTLATQIAISPSTTHVQNLTPPDDNSNISPLRRQIIEEKLAIRNNLLARIQALKNQANTGNSNTVTAETMKMEAKQQNIEMTNSSKHSNSSSMPKSLQPQAKVSHLV